MKILIIQPWISYRGAESISLDEAHGLKKLGHSVVIACVFVDRKRLRTIDRELNFLLPPDFISKLSQKSSLFFLLFGFFILLFLTLKEGKKVDIYNPHNFPGLWVAAIGSYLFKKPVYWTVHNFPQHGVSNYYIAFVWEAMTFYLDNFIVKRIKGVISVSYKVREELYNRYKRESRVIYPPLDVTYFDLKRKKPSSSAFWIILIPTKIHRVKNIAFALSVIEQVLRKKKNVMFFFAGEGPMLQFVKRQLKELEIEKNCRLLGFVQKEKLRDWYAAASLVFLPGVRGEGFNITVLEALSSGTPSLVIRGSGVDAWIEKHNSGFVTEFDSQKAAEDLLTLLSDKKKLEEAVICGKKTIQRHKPTQYAKALLKEFHI